MHGGHCHDQCEAHSGSPQIQKRNTYPEPIFDLMHTAAAYRSIATYNVSIAGSLYEIVPLVQAAT